MSTRQCLIFSHIGKIFRLAPFIVKGEKNLSSPLPEKILGYSKRLFSRVAKKTKTALTHEDEDSEGIKTSKENEEGGLATKLTSWALQNNISTHALTQLFKILAESGMKDLPKNSRVILKKREESIIVCSIPPGKYVHLGLENNLRKVISALAGKQLLRGTNVEVSVFIDNLPLSQFTNYGLWIILGSVIGCDTVIFIIGAYFGFSKPKDSNLFLSHFVNETKNLCKKGLQIDENKYSVNIRRVICDSPAKAFILNIKSATGYSSCTKCDAIGVYNTHKICFPQKSNLLTDKHFENNEYYNKNKTKLLEIPNFGVVSNVPLDYMHLVCIGVVKKLISIWLSKNKDYWLSKSDVSSITKESSKFTPSEFRAKLKSLIIYNRWDSTNFRQFLLYTGPVLMKNVLIEKYYNNFLYLHVACRLLCMERSKDNIEQGQVLLHEFIKTYETLYGRNEVTYNVHGLYHLVDDCKLHGTLDKFSAFPYELYLLKLRNLMKKSRKRSFPLSVFSESHEKILLKSIQKITQDTVTVSKVVKPSEDDLKNFKNYTQYERLVTNQFLICPQEPAEKYLLLNNGIIIEVTNILKMKKNRTDKDFYVAGKKFLSVQNFYTKPMKSSLLDVFKVKNVSSEVHIWPVDAIKTKCMMIPFNKDEYVMAALLDCNF